MNTTRRHFLQSAAASSFLAASAAALPSRLEDEAPEKDSVEKAEEPLDLLILGGTGILGPWTVRRARARGHTMTLFNRGFTNPDLFPDLEHLQGDRNEADYASLEGRTFDAVVDTSAYVPAHVELTAGMAAQWAQHYVLLSSISVFADHGIPYGDHESPVREVTDEEAATATTIGEAIALDYGALKARCEVVAETAMPGKVTVIRPGLISGPGDHSDRFGYWAVRTARGGRVLAPGTGLDWVQYIDVRDLAKWVIHCIEQRVAGTYNAITPPGRFTMQQLLHAAKASVVTDAEFEWVSPEFLEEQGVQHWTTLPVYVPAVDDGAGFHLAASARAEAAGLTYRPLAETIADTVAWYAETRPADYDFPRGSGMSRKQEAELLAAWDAKQGEEGK